MKDVSAVEFLEEEELFKLDPIWKQAALTASRDFRYGDVITHAWLREHLEIEEPTGPLLAEEFQRLALTMLTRVEGFKDEMLRQHNCYLVNVRGDGYRITKPPEQTDAAMKRLQKELRKEVRKAADALHHIDRALLGIEDAQKNAEAKAKLAWLSGAVRKRIADKKPAQSVRALPGQS